MINEKLSNYHEWLSIIHERISKDLVDIQENFDEYDWQESQLGFLLDEDKVDQNYEDYYALEEAQKLVYRAAEHLKYIMERKD